MAPHLAPPRFFNSNNLWVNLGALKAAMAASGGALDLPLIKNKKTVNPRDSKSAPVYQLETAMGSAIECFDTAGALLCGRGRTSPAHTRSKARRMSCKDACCMLHTSRACLRLPRGACSPPPGAIVVPRTRFAPVKTCSDLFLLRSDVYRIAEDSTIEATIPVVPLVKLDDAHYKLVGWGVGLRG